MPIEIFITFCCLSFLYKDNPFYKLIEHLFIGVSVGYLIVLQYGENIEPKVVDAIFGGGVDGAWLALRVVALVLVVMMFAKVLQPRWAWLGRYPLAFVVAFVHRAPSAWRSASSVRASQLLTASCRRNCAPTCTAVWLDV